MSGVLVWKQNYCTCTEVCSLTLIVFLFNLNMCWMLHFIIKIWISGASGHISLRSTELHDHLLQNIQEVNISYLNSVNWPAGALTTGVLPALGTMKRDWMKEPRALTMSLNTLVECCFMSYDWQNELEKENNTEHLIRSQLETGPFGCWWSSLQNYTVKSSISGHLRVCMTCSGSDLRC